MTMAEEKSETYEQILQVYEDVKAKNELLRRLCRDAKSENHFYKEKYNYLKGKVENLDSLLEKNATVFNEMLNNTINSLQIVKCLCNEVGKNPNNFLSSALSSAAKQKEPEGIHNAAEATVETCDKRGTSGNSKSAPEPDSIAVPINVTLRRPISIRKRSQEIEDEVEEDVEDNSAPEDQSISNDITLLNVSKENGFRLSPILERTEASPNKELMVKLKRISDETLHEHIKKQKIEYSTSVTLDELSETLQPTFSSTPNQIEIMKTLNLQPTPKTPKLEQCNFVNFRKRNGGTIISRRNTSVVSKSPKIEKISPEKNTKDEITTTFRQKRALRLEKETPVKQRLQRKAKPKTLAEESLKKKMRRN